MLIWNGFGLNCPAVLSLNAFFGGSGAVLKWAICLLLGTAAIMYTGRAEARCGDQYAGPTANNPAYLFSSSCKATIGNQVQLRNEICSITAGNLPFSWDKLNWVSGSQGIRSGQCLSIAVPTNAANAIDVPDSTIRLFGDLKRSDTTNVFLSGNAGNQEEIEKSISRTALKDGGEILPFQFKISFAARGSNRVSIRASMQAGDPVFYIYLPPNIRNEDGLRSFISPDYLEKIRPYISFNDKNDRVGAHDSDPVIASYRERNELPGRARVSMLVPGERAEIAFDVNGTLSDIASSVKVCAGEFKAAITCL